MLEKEEVEEDLKRRKVITQEMMHLQHTENMVLDRRLRRFRITIEDQG